MDARQRGQRVDEGGDVLLGGVEAHPVEAVVELVDPLEDQRLGLRRHPAQPADPTRLRSLAELLDGLDAQLRIDLADGLRSEPRDAEQLDKAGRDLGTETL